MPKPWKQPMPHEEVIRALDEMERRGLERRHISYLLERALDERFQDPQEAMFFIIETFGLDETVRMIRELARRER